MKHPRLASRRRVLRLVAASGGLAAAGLAGMGRPVAAPRRWQGVALGAQASLTLYHSDGETADGMIRAAVAELRRLERIFSLYREDSALSVLNRQGSLETPPPELVRLLSEARRYSELTGGAFDATVQPLWRLYAQHFAEPDADPSGPSERAVRRALELVDYRAVEVGLGRIAFARPGMAITLNGIAQGFVTDCVANLLRAGGMDSVLVDLGEIRGIGGHPDGRPWLVGLQDPSDTGQIVGKVALSNAALATSAGQGFSFDRAGRQHHLFDPRTGRSTHAHASVSVVAPTATEADALSTAMTGMEESAVRGLVGRMDGVTAYLTGHDGAARRVQRVRKAGGCPGYCWRGGPNA